MTKTKQSELSTTKPTAQPFWERNDIQFARLLAEISASGALTDEIHNTLLESMDLQPDELHQLVSRAEQSWTDIKSALITQPSLVNNKLVCPYCRYDGEEETENGGNFRYLASTTSWRTVDKINDGVLIIDGYYQLYDEEEKEERLECRSCLKEFLIPAGLEIDFQ